MALWAPDSLSSVTSSRAENLAFFKTQYGLDDVHARLLLRAERLQEKGQTAQAVAYFEQVLKAYPGCNEARMNAEMLRSMASAPAGSSAGQQLQIPDDAELFTYMEGIGGCNICAGDVLKRLPDGRSKFSQWCDECEADPSNVLYLPKESSDRLWASIMTAIQDGSGMSTTDPTNWHESTWMSAVSLSVTFSGTKTEYFTSGHSPVEKLVKQAVETRRHQLGM